MQYIKRTAFGKIGRLLEKDYKNMIGSMVYGKKLSFDELIEKIADVQKIINNRS